MSCTTVAKLGCDGIKYLGKSASSGKVFTNGSIQKVRKIRH